MSRCAIIIPARWGSTRFPGKPLHPLGGKILLQHVWERCLRAKCADLVVVATDDMRIAEAAFAFGAEVSMTSPKHPSGTDRIAEVAERLGTGFGTVINVQGDEPRIDPRLIDRLANALRASSSLAMATAACPLELSERENPNCVKVVTGVDGDALYFSRAAIPFDRDGDSKVPLLRHLGIYAYRRKFLLEFVKWKPSPLERTEKLEQLRALEHGARIRVLVTKSAGPGIDTPEDALAFEASLRASAAKAPGDSD